MDPKNKQDQDRPITPTSTPEHDAEDSPID